MYNCNGGILSINSSVSEQIFPGSKILILLLILLQAWTVPCHSPNENGISLESFSSDCFEVLSLSNKKLNSLLFEQSLKSEKYPLFKLSYKSMAIALVTSPSK